MTGKVQVDRFTTKTVITFSRHNTNHNMYRYSYAQLLIVYDIPICWHQVYLLTFVALCNISYMMSDYIDVLFSEIF